MKTTPSDNNQSHAGSFTIGLAIGVIGALLLGTEEGRKLVRKAFEAVPDRFRTPPVGFPQFTPRNPIIPTEETLHQEVYEAPPPAAPVVRPTLAEPFKPK